MRLYHYSPGEREIHGPEDGAQQKGDSVGLVEQVYCHVLDRLRFHCQERFHFHVDGHFFVRQHGILRFRTNSTRVCHLCLFICWRAVRYFIRLKGKFQLSLRPRFDSIKIHNFTVFCCVTRNHPIGLREMSPGCCSFNH